MTTENEVLYEVTMSVSISVYSENPEAAEKMVREAINKGLDDELATDAQFYSVRAEEMESA